MNAHAFGGNEKRYNTRRDCRLEITMGAIEVANADACVGAQMVLRESSNRAILTSGVEGQMAAMFITGVVNRAREAIYPLGNTLHRGTGYGPCLNGGDIVDEVDDHSGDKDPSDPSQM